MQLDAVTEPYTIENAPDLIELADRGLGGTSCGFAGDVTLECVYRIASGGGELSVLLRFQATGFVAIEVS